MNALITGQSVRTLTDAFLDLLAALVVENPNDSAATSKAIIAEVKRRDNKTRQGADTPRRELPAHQPTS